MQCWFNREDIPIHDLLEPAGVCGQSQTASHFYITPLELQESELTVLCKFSSTSVEVKS